MKIISIPLQHIRERVKERPEGYYEDVVSCGTIVGDRDLLIDFDKWIELIRKYNDPKTAAQRITWQCC